MNRKAVLALEDGKVFYGYAFASHSSNIEITGEVVFNTSMIGYQEILTDPSYKGQIVVMTYPHIGNYGVNSEDFESSKVQVEGFVVREYSKVYSNWRADKSLQEFLVENKIVGIEGIDTRALVKHIRSKGAMKGIISTVDFKGNSLVEKARSAPSIIGRDLVKEVTCSDMYTFAQSSVCNEQYRVVVINCGVKTNILRSIKNVGCLPIVVPANTSAEKILGLNPDGILISNGPGDPEGVPYLIDTVRKLFNSQLPIMGICLGHQIIALASGGKTYKLKFGHRGANQPIKNLLTGRVEITVENHGFAVMHESFENALKDFIVTHQNLNDGTIEGMEHKYLPIFSVQFHPEASPGPHDTRHLFDKFCQMMQMAK